jgi:hypothetical protein
MAALARACLLLTLVALATAVAAQSGLRSLRDDNITVYFEQRDEQFATVALQAAVTALPTLEVALLKSPPRPDERRPITIQVVRSTDELSRIVGQAMKPWTQGVALPGRRIVVQTLAPGTMKVVVAHELTHVLLDELAERLDVEPPRWLHEGLAKLSTDDFSENDREVLGQAVRERRLMRLTTSTGPSAASGSRSRWPTQRAIRWCAIFTNCNPAAGWAAFSKILRLRMTSRGHY